MRTYGPNDLPGPLYDTTVEKGAESKPIATWFSLVDFVKEFETIDSVVSESDREASKELYSLCVQDIGSSLVDTWTVKGKSPKYYLPLAYINLQYLRDAVDRFMKIPVLMPYLAKALLTLILGTEAGSFEHEIRQKLPRGFFEFLFGPSKTRLTALKTGNSLAQLFLQTQDLAIHYPSLQALMKSTAEQGCYVNPMAHRIVSKALEKSN